MDIVLSNAPPIIFRNLTTKGSLKKWIYFGRNEQVLANLNQIFGDAHEQIIYAHELFDISQKKRSDFIRWMDDISAAIPSKEWLFSVPATKNTYSSHLFLYICYFLVLQDLIHKKKIPDIIIVDSPALGFLLKKYFHAKYLPVNYGLKLIKQLQVTVWSILRFGKYFVEFMRIFWAAKSVLKTRGHDLLKGQQNLVILRNFITGDFTDTNNDIFIRHYFPGLDDYLKENGYAAVYLPIIIKTKNYRDLCVKVQKSKRTIVFAEEFLKISDYFALIKTVIRAMFLRIKAPPLDSFDFQALIKEEYISNFSDHGALLAHVLSKLGRRLAEAQIKPAGIINWHENQALEKGLISGFKESFPGIQVIGSQPFLSPPNHLSMMPSNQDKLLGLVPDKILVLGPIGEASVKEFVSDLSVDFSPAFRYANVLNHTPPKRKENNLLVLLGYGFHNALHMMQVLLEADKKFNFGKVFVKVHPVGNYDRKRLCAACPAISKHFNFVDGPLEEYLDQISIGICGATGTAVELILSKIPVIIIGDTHSLTMNYLSHKNDPQMWRLCFSVEEVADALKNFKETILQQPEALEQKAKAFRQAFFASPDKCYWKNYLLN